MDPNREWLRKIVGEGVVDAQIGDLVKQGAGWITAFLKSLWSGGQALISIFSLMVVTPVVAFYLLYDWNRMVAAVDNWVPLQHREIVRGARAGNGRRDRGFRARADRRVPDPRLVLRGGADAVGPQLRAADRARSGIITFIPYVGSMTGLVLAAGVAIAQFWPEYTPILIVLAIFFVGQFLEGYVLAPKLVGESVGLHPVWLMFALFAFGYAVRLRRAADRGAARRRDRRAGALRAAALSREPVLHRRAGGRLGRVHRRNARWSRTAPHERSASACARAAARGELRARGFPHRAPERGGARYGRALARLARSRACCWSAPKARERAIWRRSGPRSPARAGSRRARSARPTCIGRACDRRAGGRGCAGAARRARAVPPAQPDARGGGLPADHGAHAAGAAGASRCPISRRGCAPFRRWR